MMNGTTLMGKRSRVEEDGLQSDSYSLSLFFLGISLKGPNQARIFLCLTYLRHLRFILFMQYIKNKFCPNVTLESCEINII